MYNGIKQDKIEDYLFKANIVITLSKKDWAYESLIPYANKNNNKDFSLFCDVLYMKSLDTNETDSNVLYIQTDDLVKHEMPLNQIKAYWNAGWPRAGIMIERLTEFPWRLLKPMKGILNEETRGEDFQPLDISSLKSQSPIYDLYNEFVEVYHDKKINANQEEKTGLVKTYYNKLFDIHKQTIDNAMQVHDSVKVYLQVIIKDKTVLEDKENVFVEYINTRYADIINQILKKHKM